MKYNYFIERFKWVYIIQIFDDKNFKTFCQPTFWWKNVIAGPPSNFKLKYPLVKWFNKKITILDSDNNWFNNP